MTLDRKNLPSMLLRGLAYFAAGLAIGFLTAPKTGRGARSWLSQRASHWRAQGREIGVFARKKAHYQEGRLAGAAHRLQQLRAVPEQDKYVDEDLISQRVRTALGENRMTSHIPRINVDTVNGIVTLRGGVEMMQDKMNLERVVGAVSGVEAVVNKVVIAGKRATGGA